VDAFDVRFVLLDEIDREIIFKEFISNFDVKVISGTDLTFVIKSKSKDN